jgi:hypothetical protein
MLGLTIGGAPGAWLQFDPNHLVELGGDLFANPEVQEPHDVRHEPSECSCDSGEVLLAQLDILRIHALRANRKARGLTRNETQATPHPGSRLILRERRDEGHVERRGERYWESQRDLEMHAHWHRHAKARAPSLLSMRLAVDDRLTVVLNRNSHENLLAMELDRIPGERVSQDPSHHFGRQQRGHAEKVP